MHRLLPDVVALAREAGRAILGVYSSSFTVQEKDDSSPLTEADLRAQDCRWEEIALRMGGTAQGRRKQLARAIERVSQELGLDL